MKKIEQFKALVQQDLDAVNALVLKMTQSNTGLDLIDTLGHHLIKAGGKQIRPLIALLSSRACGYEGDLHIISAALIECFHNATLLHDDVIDESTLRRGKETVNSIWGNKASILVGDFLLTIALLELLFNIKNDKIRELIAQTTRDITRGELKQLANRNNFSLSHEDYFDIIHAKTALLFATSSAIGPLLTDENHPLEQAFYNYGLHLGNAFQLIDDTLDYASNADVMGKNNGDDLADGKLTLPIIHLLKHGNEIQKQLVMHSLENGSREHFAAILDALDSTGAIEYTRAAANHEKNLAIQSLEEVPDSPYKQALIDLAYFALERDY